MRRAIAIFLALCVLCLTTGASWHTVLTGIVTSGLTAQDGYTGATASASGIGQFSSSKWFASYIDTTATYDVAQIVARLYKSGSPTQTLTAKIYTNSTTSPGTQVGADSDSVSASSLPSSEGDVTFTWSGTKPSLTTGTRYWVVIVASATNSSNYVLWARQSADVDTNFRTKVSTDGSTWSNLSNSTSQKFILYQ